MSSSLVWRMIGLGSLPLAVWMGCGRPSRPPGPPPEYIRPEVEEPPVHQAPDPFRNLEDAIIDEVQPERAPVEGAPGGAGGGPGHEGS